MPNWCNNGITLRHADPAIVDRAQHSKGLLSEFIPTPQELLDTMAGSYGDDEKQRALEAQEQSNVAKYGHKNWYDWNVANWGTKWDFELENVQRVDENTLTATFDSAWAPPIEAYVKLLALGFEIEAFYWEPGMGFAGKFTGNGDEFDDDYVDYSGESVENIRECIGEELDDYWCISENLALWEQED